MRVQYTSATGRRARRAVAVALSALLVVGAGLVATAAPAAADTIRVPFVDRLGCTPETGYAATSTPVFSKVGGSGPVADGTTMRFDSAVSAYPVQPGVFSGVANPSGSFGYGSFGQDGYGATTYYSGANGIGFSSIDAASQGTLTVTLPYAQRMQFTVGGINLPSNIDVSGTSATGTAVPAQSAAKSTAPDAAGVQTVGDTARITGSSQAAGDDTVPQRAVDVWFDQPVQTLTFRVFGSASTTPSDGGFLITPPIGCQSGGVTADDATGTVTDVATDDAGDTSVTYTVPLSTSVTNTSTAENMRLLPTVRSDLRARVAELGGTLDGIAQASSSDPACAVPADVLTSNHLLGSTAALAPQASCTQTATATITLPLDADPRTLTATSTLASSANDTYSRVKGTDTSTITFPAVRSALTVDASGTTETLPTKPVERRFTVTSVGPDTAGRSTISIDDPNGFPATDCRIEGLEAQPTCADLLSGDPVSLGAMPAGATRTVVLTGAVPSGTAAGTTYPLAATVSSPVQPAGPQSASATLTVTGPTTPVFTAPTSGSSTTERRPGIFGGGAVPGGQVTVRQGSTVVCTATGLPSGNWSCTANAPLPYGAVTLTATEEFGGLTSGAGSLTFTVQQPAPPVPPTTGQPGGPAPAPGTGGGSGGAGPNPGGGSGGSAGGGSSPSAPRPSTPRPSTPGSATPTPTPPTSTPTAPSDAGPSGGSVDDSSGGGGGSGDSDSATNNGPLTMDFRFGTQRIMPGTAADMRGTLGPNASGATVAITFQARMSTGMVYRDVAVEVDDQPLDCTVATTSFSCLIPLDPGQQADVDVRVYADPVNAPDTAVQQISLASTRASQGNAMTVTTAVAKGETEASQLADQITTFNVTEFPGAMVPLLAMLLFALAATVVGRRGGDGPADPATTSPTGAGPPGASRASSPTGGDRRADLNDPTTEPPSGSNR